MSLFATLTSSIPTWCYLCKGYIDIKSKPRFSSICQSCYYDLPEPFALICQHCGLEHKTSDCDQPWARSIENFDYLFPYTEPLKRWISSLKYSRNFIAGRILQYMITQWMIHNRFELDEIDSLVPVPIASGRLRWRGFNQSVYLLNHQRVLFRDLDCIQKIRSTPQQAGLDKKKRIGIQKGSFEVKKDVRGKRIMLFDDVCTTGQTLAEITHILKKKGAEKVRVLVLCRSH